MAEFGVDWFNLSNYRKMRELTYADWMTELTTRINAYNSLTGDDIKFSAEMESFIANINVYQSVFNERGRQHALMTIAAIKQHGLISKISLPEVFTVCHQSEFMKKLDQLLDAQPKKTTISQLQKKDQLYVAASIKRPEWMFPTLLEVDLGAHPDHIKQDFEQWLKKQMKLRNSRSTKNIDEQIKRCITYNVIAYWDLKNISALDGLVLTSQEIGERLFPEDKSSDLSDRVRKTIAPQCESFFSEETIGCISYLS